MHGETAYLASVAQEVRLKEAIIGEESGHEERHRVVFKRPRTVDYRASVHDIANYLIDLMQNENLRMKMGQAARKRVVEKYNYRVVAKRFIDIVSDKIGVS